MEVVNWNNLSADPVLKTSINAIFTASILCKVFPFFKCFFFKSVYYVITLMFSYFIDRRAIRFGTAKTKCDWVNQKFSMFYSLGIIF